MVAVPVVVVLVELHGPFASNIGTNVAGLSAVLGPRLTFHSDGVVVLVDAVHAIPVDDAEGAFEVSLTGRVVHEQAKLIFAQLLEGPMPVERIENKDSDRTYAGHRKCRRPDFVPASDKRPPCLWARDRLECGRNCWARTARIR